MLFLGAVVPTAVQAQSVTPEVISGAGGNFQSATHQISWTLGETVIETFNTAGNILTQGFHQPEILLTGLPDYEGNSGEITAFPNPVRDRLSINFEGLPKGIYTLYISDIRGRRLSQQLITLDSGQQQVSLDVAGLSEATYMLEVYKKDHSVHKAIQFIKITQN